jgi:tight adherence protein B
MFLALTATILVFLIVYLLFTQLMIKRYSSASEHTQHILEQVRSESQNLRSAKSNFVETLEILKADINQSPFFQFVSYLPFGKRLIVKLVRAGKQKNAVGFLTFFALLLIGSLTAAIVLKLGTIYICAAIILPIWLCNKVLSSSITKRNNIFINMFPDVLDMIVRSVKSGFPVSSAINMVVENMDDPVKSEFRQLADELALGRSLSDALDRLAVRIDEQDIKFFVVVLKIQQETGGNLAEIMSNLSNIIRKRKQLRQKIRAMTSEGRITGYILAMIPILVFGVLFFMSPQHLDPLFNTELGNKIFAVAIGMVILSQVIVRKMVNIDI